MDHNYRFGVGAEYQINRFFSIDIRYIYGGRDSTTDDNDFRKSVSILTLEARL